eukprot:gene7877-10693_t
MVIQTILIFIYFVGVQHAFQFQHRTSFVTIKSSNSNSNVQTCNPRFGDKKEFTQTRLNMAIKGPVRYSTSDWFECILTLPASRILNRIKYKLGFFTAFAAILTLIYNTFSVKFYIPLTLHSILGSALSLLLVFRTNSSYDRFWEGRKMWSTFKTCTRDLARETFVHIDKSKHAKIGCILTALCWSVKQHLQGDKIDSEIAPWLTATTLDIQTVQKQKNRPNFLLRYLSSEIHNALHEKYPNSLEATLHEGHFSELTHHISGAITNCERIVKQPVPLAYTRHTSRFLSLYLFSLPFALIKDLNWWSVPVMSAFCWSFACIQEIGLFIEDPFNKEFNLIPLSRIITVIESDLSEMLDGAIASPELEKFDRSYSSPADKIRMKTDDWFAYGY